RQQRKRGAKAGQPIRRTDRAIARIIDSLDRYSKKVTITTRHPERFYVKDLLLPCNPLPKRQEPNMSEEVEVEICCDVLLDAIESGGIQVVEVSPGIYVEVVPNQNGSSGIAVNFCPFCGA